MTNVITIGVVWRVFTVFPLNFTTSEFLWDVLVRFVMVVAIVGASIGVAVNTVKLIRSVGT